MMNILFVLFGLLSFTSKASHFNKVRSSSGKFVGVYSSEGVTWFEAARYCDQLGAHYKLATIRSYSENEEALEAAIEAGAIDKIWIGLHDQAYESNFEWVDGSEYNFNNWDYNEPNDQCSCNDQDCVHMSINGKWSDLRCNQNCVNSFVCQDLTPEPEPEPAPVPPSPSTPKWPEPCLHNPCNCGPINSGITQTEDFECNICHYNGCDECKQIGINFKKDYNYPCVNCQDTFGDACLECQDFNGCSICKNGYERTKNYEHGLWYCKPKGGYTDETTDETTYETDVTTMDTTDETTYETDETTYDTGNTYETEDEYEFEGNYGGGYVTIKNGDGCNKYYHVFSIENIGVSITISKVYISSTSNNNEWIESSSHWVQSGSYYCTFNFNNWNTPYGVRIVTTDGQIMTKYNLITNIYKGSAFSMGKKFNQVYNGGGNVPGYNGGSVTITAENGCNNGWYALSLNNIDPSLTISKIYLSNKDYEWFEGKVSSWDSKIWTFNYGSELQTSWDLPYNIKIIASNGEEIEKMGVITSFYGTFDTHENFNSIIGQFLDVDKEEDC